MQRRSSSETAWRMMPTLGLCRVGELRRIPKPPDGRDGVPKPEKMDGKLPAIVAFRYAPGKCPAKLVAQFPVVRFVAVFPVGAFFADRVVEPQDVGNQIVVAVGHQAQRMQQPGQNPHTYAPRLNPNRNTWSPGSQLSIRNV